MRGRLAALYWTDVLCPRCWAGLVCALLADRAGEEGACHLRTAAPPIAPAWHRPGPDRAAAARLLGVELDADATTIRKAARQALFHVHRDRGGSDDAARALIEARDLLLREWQDR